MKLLVAAASLPPYESATGLLLSKLFPYLQDAGISIDGLACKSSFTEGDSVMYGDIEIKMIDYLLATPHPQKCFRDWLYGVRRYLPRKFKEIFHVPQGKNFFYKPLKDATVKYLRKFDFSQYDAVMVSAGYFVFMQAFYEYKEKYGLDIPLIFYQVDPLGDYSLIKTEEERAHLQEVEKRFYDCSDYVFTPPPIYEKKKALGWNVDNVIPLEFPIDLVDSGSVPHGDEIKCLFAGHLYGELRDATKTLEIFSAFTNPNIHLYIAGTGQQALIKSFANGPLKGRIHHLGGLSSDDCDKAMMDADFLINVDNKSTVQVPSKLLHSIGIGKPIINVAVTKDSASLPYVNRYPIAKTVYDIDEAAELQRWIEENTGKTVPLSYRKKAFETCSKEYIANTIIEVLKKLDAKKG